LRRTLLTTAAVALIAGSASSAAVAAKPKPTGTLSIVAASPLITFGNYAKLSGALSTKETGVSVTLQALAFPYTGKYTDVATVPTTTDGAYAFSPLAATNAKWRAVAKTKPSTTSAEVLVSVRWRVGLGVADSTPAKGQRVRFSGTVKPVHANAIVYVQRLTATGWKNVKQTTLKTGTATSSNYVVRVTIKRSGKYRTAVLGDGAHETGVSRVRKLTVH
jgi:hypothetical protein